MDSKRPQTAAKRPARVGQPLDELANYMAGSHRLLFKRPIAVIFVLLLIAVAVIIWHTNRTQSNLVEAQALHSAEQLSNALTEFRTIYTSEVVERIRKEGVTVTHDYEHRVGAIPLPATMSLMLGEKIGAHDNSTQTSLYSPYPFPWRRAEGGLTDDFEEDAWEFLTKRPDTPYYRIEELGGIPVLRYATADLMRSACVDCHNTHPESPKTDWKIGEVRGILEIITPPGRSIRRIPLKPNCNGPIDATDNDGRIAGHRRRIARSPTGCTEAQDLANQTFETNRELEKEVTGRKRAETALRKAHDNLELQVAKRTSELRQEIVVRQNAEMKLRDAEKMQALGTLAEGIAHNFNYALVPIRALSELLMREFPPESPNNEMLKKSSGVRNAHNL